MQRGEGTVMALVECGEETQEKREGGMGKQQEKICYKWEQKVGQKLKRPKDTHFFLQDGK